MAYTPNRGDIVRLQFDPASGQEMKGPHFGFVVSAKAFNSRGLAIICPISQGEAATARTHGTVVSLMESGSETQGAIHCHQLKSLDWRIRNAKFKEAVPKVIIEDVAARIEAILFE